MSPAAFDFSEPPDAGDRHWPIRVVPHPRARRLRLVCDPVRREFRLTIPRRYDPVRALDWALRHRDWAAEQAARAVPIVPVGPGATLPFRGRTLRIAWDASAPRAPRLDGWTEDGPGQPVLHLGGDPAAVGGRVARWLQEQARAVFTPHSHALAARVGKPCRAIGLGDPRTRWGSCTADGRIRYNWRLVMAPDGVWRATVAHEVAHLRYMHHGPDFHALVAQLHDGDPAEARSWLRAHGQGLRALSFAKSSAFAG